MVLSSQQLDCGENVKIIDFGGAQYYERGKVTRSLFGTREYMAPETLNYDPIEFRHLEIIYGLFSNISHVF